MGIPLPVFSQVPSKGTKGFFLDLRDVSGSMLVYYMLRTLNLLFSCKLGKRIHSVARFIPSITIVTEKKTLLDLSNLAATMMIYRVPRRPRSLLLFGRPLFGEKTTLDKKSAYLGKN